MTFVLFYQRHDTDALPSGEEPPALVKKLAAPHSRYERDDDQRIPRNGLNCTTEVPVAISQPNQNAQKHYSLKN
jgi:hypothetical protein